MSYLPTSQGVYNSSAPTMSNGAAGPIQLDVNGNQLVNLAKTVAGEDITNNFLLVQQRCLNVYISTATTTTIVSGRVFLHAITVGGGTAGTITVYNSTTGSGTVVLAFDSTNALQTYTFDEDLANGLTIVTSAATKLNVSYVTLT